MKVRIVLFLIFQFFAWGLYLYWGEDQGHNMPERSEKVLEVFEIPSAILTRTVVEERKFKLILRDDGIFTKINADRSTENGMWAVNYDIPSLILKSPGGDYKYRILNEQDEKFQIELINAHELARARNEKEESNRRLFSSSSIN